MEDIKKIRIFVILFGIFLGFIGTLLFINGITPKIIELSVTPDNTINAQFSEKDALSPFDVHTKRLSNVKQAIISKQRGYKTGNFYVLELENFDGYTMWLISSEFYDTNKDLQIQINQAIQNKTNFKYKMYEYFIAIGGLFIAFLGIITIVMLFRFQKFYCYCYKTKNNDNIQNTPIIEKDKSKKINDSIIS